MKQLVAILLALTLTSCAVFVPATTEPVATVVLNPKIEQTTDAMLDVWCRNLTNTRRIVLRLIHALDPQWQSVCTQRGDNQ